MRSRVLAAAAMVALSGGQVFSQTVPDSFNQAETTSSNSASPTINSLPANLGYSILNYNSSSGTRSTSSVSINNTFGVSTEGSGTQNASVSNFARVGISDTCDNCNGVKNTIGGETGITRYETSTEYSGSLPGMQTAATDVTQSSNTTTTITGVTSTGTLNMGGAGQVNGSVFESKSSISESAAGADGADGTKDKTNNTVSGAARGFLNTGMTVDTQQSSFTNIFLNAF